MVFSTWISSLGCLGGSCGFLDQNFHLDWLDCCAAPEAGVEGEATFSGSLGFFDQGFQEEDEEAGLGFSAGLGFCSLAGRFGRVVWGGVAWGGLSCVKAMILASLGRGLAMTEPKKCAFSFVLDHIPSPRR